MFTTTHLPHPTPQVDDLILKQLAVERLVRRADASEAQAEIVAWRFRDAEARNKILGDDNQQLRWAASSLWLMSRRAWV